MNDRANTIAGWVLGAGIAALGLTIVTGEHFKAERPEKMGYAVQGVEQDTILLQNIFQLETVERDGARIRELVPTGIRPQVMHKIEQARIFLAPDFFQAPTEGGPRRTGR